MTIINYTTKRLHSKTASGKPIEICPKCGRKAELTEHVQGSKQYTHVKESYASLFWNVTDYCYIPETEAHK